MIRILFVEGQAATLAGLQDRLRPLQALWQMRFANSGAMAMSALLAQPFDAIITDMRLPDMDGARLLAEVQSQHPDLLRFVWSTDPRRYGALHALPVAHQMLSKNCPLEQLRGILERSHALQQRLMAPAVRRTLAQLKSLPALPQVYTRLSEALESPTVNSAGIAAILEQDVGMTARILQMANSAYFPAVRKVTHVKDAVTKLGMLSLRGVVLTLDLFRAASARDLPPGFSLDDLQRHSLLVGQTAAGMLEDPVERQTAFSAGMLHDIGYLLFATGLPKEWAAVRARAVQERRPLHELETELLGCSHAEIGGRVLALWGLPNPLVEAVTYHHRPAASGQKHFGVVAAVHVANALAHVGQEPLSQHSNVLVDEDFLTRIGGLKALEPGFHAPRAAAA